MNEKRVNNERVASYAELLEVARTGQRTKKEHHRSTMHTLADRRLQEITSDVSRFSTQGSSATGNQNQNSSQLAKYLHNERSIVLDGMEHIKMNME